ncbi:MAG: phosphoribosylaminoimidazolesuccinocarboxamide synthase [Candidatus Kerfeldbacteria bacterium]|nr:phosphoribosylaminoimidazolesuccinocarboxamide synthase [Candidatus Kerfeldbacteria bacterium]
MVDRDRIAAQVSHCLTETNFDQLGTKYHGKVRDTYDLGDRLLLITTDRQSAFDRILAAIPFKGQVLNQVSAWWFEQTKDIVPNHVLSLPDPNALLAKKCTVFPVEFVVRGYLSGVTSTSAWMAYNKGERTFCGNLLPDGMVKNQAFAQPIITPTTKSDTHDEKVSADEVVARGLMSQADWDQCAKYTLELFKRGQALAQQHGLILVDTKYEFGKLPDGTIILVDEVHTPDSSRYWLANTYAAKFAHGEEPENIDKEFLRLWFMDHCDPYHDKELPAAPEELVIELSARYIQLYEMITGQEFIYPDSAVPIISRITNSLATDHNPHT